MSLNNLTDRLKIINPVGSIDNIKNNMNADNFSNYFIQASQHATSPFWQQELIKASEGIFPANFSYSNETLFYDDGQNISILPLSIDPAQLASQFISFCSGHGYQEKTDESETYFIKANLALENSWSAATKKVHRCKMIELFIQKLRDKYNLNSAELKQLRDLITLETCAGSINKDNIIVQNYTISQIKGLNFDTRTRKFWMDEEYRPKLAPLKTKSVRKAKAKPGSNYSQEWIKYLDTCVKKYQGLNPTTSNRTNQISSNFETPSSA